MAQFILSLKCCCWLLIWVDELIVIVYLDYVGCSRDNGVYP